MNLDDLKEERRRAWEALKVSSAKLKRATALMQAIKARHIQCEETYYRSERALALLDGRLQICQPHERKKREAPQQELSLEQLLKVAEMLGVDLATGDKETIEDEDDLYEQEGTD